ncbi:MAG: amino acid ABC transporter substrate-binding protein [Proteobacteria bacterium]|nr:amino acid ABC transporter substrate-binding protein [Pseudomonadota bacterium]MBI3497539.1 amino acid ABC transporter substrate-binding protein [Pseudomonadota bacterium]
MTAGAASIAQFRGSRGFLPLLLGLAFLVLGPGKPGAQTPEPVDPNPEKPLLVAADVGFAPFAMRQADGTLTGFSIDLAAELARRLGRPGYEISDQRFSGIFAGLAAKRYEFVVAATVVTEERAGQMLFSEPYMTTGLGVLVWAGEAEMNGPDALKGKTVAALKGGQGDTWASENGPKLGFQIVRFDRTEDVVGAVLSTQAAAAILDLPRALYAAQQEKRIRVGLTMAADRVYALAFRHDDVAFRNKVDLILESMKKDGALAVIYEKWFGMKPPPGSASVEIFPGYGTPGFPGYVPQK